MQAPWSRWKGRITAGEPMSSGARQHLNGIARDTLTKKMAWQWEPSPPEPTPLTPKCPKLDHRSMLSLYTFFKFSIFERSRHVPRWTQTRLRPQEIGHEPARYQGSSAGDGERHHALGVHAHVMRDPDSTAAQKMDAAKGAAPYVHARFAHVERKTEATSASSPGSLRLQPLLRLGLDRQRRLASTH